MRTTFEERRHSRAVELLELLGSLEARALLEQWAAGYPGSVLTDEARRAISRHR